MHWSRQIGRSGMSPRTRQFVEAVREVRERESLSREAVAAKVAWNSPESTVTAPMIRDLELGRRVTLTLDEAIAISRALGTTVVRLLGEEI